MLTCWQHFVNRLYCALRRRYDIDTREEVQRSSSTAGALTEHNIDAGVNTGKLEVVQKSEAIQISDYGVKAVLFEVDCGFGSGDDEDDEVCGILV